MVRRRCAHSTLALAGRLMLTVVLPALPSRATAQDVAVRAYVTPATTIAAAAPFVLNVEVTGAQSLDRQPEVPDLGGFAQYLVRNTQSSMQMVNGRTSVSLTVEYRFQALTEGTFEVPPVDVVVGGQTLSTEPLQMTVVPRGQVPDGSVPAGRDQGGASGVGPDDLFITTEVSKTRVRDGEPLVVEYRIWTRVDVTSFSFTRVPEPQGFWVEDITPAGQPQVEQVTRDGQQYVTAVIRRIAMVPTGVGRRTIEPIVVEAQVRVRGNDPFDRFFGGRSLLGGGAVPAGVLSDPVTIDVEALPPGAPEPFSGVVGVLAVSATLDRDSVEANEAVTLTVRVSGDGNIRAVPAPTLELPADFEVFPPEVSESVQALGAGLTGEKTFEYVLIPRAPGEREIPAVAMSYFDDEASGYRISETEGLTLTVSGEVAEGPAALARGGVAELRRDIRFIHLGATLRPTERPLFDAAAFWMFVLLPLAGMGGAVALRRQRDLLEGDVAYARGRRASRVAKKRLVEARRLAAGEDTRAFYAEVARAVRGLVADKLNLAEAGLQMADLEALLSQKGVPVAAVARLRECLVHCDRQRFAPAGIDPEEKTRFLDRAGALMTTLDRAIGR